MIGHYAMSSPRVGIFHSLVLLSSIAPAVSAGASAGLRTVALSGQPAPGTLDDATFRRFISAPIINSSGETAFKSSLLGQEIGSESIWTDGGGTGLRLVARSYMPTPDMTEAFWRLDNPALSDTGQVAFRSNVIGGVYSIFDTRLWRETSDHALELVGGSGQPAPGTQDRFSRFRTPLLTPSGSIVFNAVLDAVGFSAKFGTWSDAASDDLTLVHRGGDVAPGLPTGSSFERAASPTINSSGEMAMHGYAMRFYNDPDPLYGVWRQDSSFDGLRLVALSGQHAAGTPDGVNFARFYSLSLSESGRTLFSGALDGAEVDDSNRNGIWRENEDESLSLVVREGDPAPSPHSDTYFGRFFPSTVISNSSGDAVFTSRLLQDDGRPSTSTNIWYADVSGSTSIVASLGDVAPGAPNGLTFDIFRELAINDNDQVAFKADLFNMDGQGIWATDRAGVLKLIVGSGDLLDTSDDPSAPELKTVSRVEFGGSMHNGAAMTSGLNDRGEVAFLASFTDGSHGVFVSMAATTPEPTSATLAVLVAMAFAAKRRWA